MKGGSLPRAVRCARAVFVAGICLSGMTACVTPVTEQLSILDKAAVCCTSMREFKYAPIFMSEEKEVALGAESPAFVFESGKSFFAAYKLPSWTAPYQIRAEAQGGNVRGGMFSPSVLMLDSEFKVTRQFNVAQGAGGNARPGIVHIFVNERDKDEQYLVLFTAKLSSPEGVNTLFATPTTIAIGTMPVQIGASETRVSLRYSPAGEIHLKVWPYQPLRAGQASRPD